MTDKNIMLVLPSDEIGGAEHVLMNIAKFYVSKGAVVYVYFLQKEKTFKWREITGVYLHFSNSSSSFGGIQDFIRKIRKERKIYDFVYSSLIHINAIISVLVKLGFLRKKNLIVRESTSVYLRFRSSKLLVYHLIYLFLYRNSIDLIICQTALMRNQLLGNCKRLNKIRCEVIPNPIIVSEIKHLAGFDVDDFSERKFVLAIGRLSCVKRFDRLIKAYSFSSLRIEYDLVILGDGPERENLESLIHRLDLQRNVKLLGHQDNVYPYIRKATLGAVSSDIEGFPNVLLQMYALNLKVVITDCCGGLEEFPDLYIDYEKTPESFARCMEEAIRDEGKVDFQEFIARYDISTFITNVERSLKEI